MSSTQVATLSSSRTTTSLRSRFVPKAAACGLLVMEHRLIIFRTLSPIWILSVPRLFGYLMYDVMLGHVSSECHLDLAL
jgi:hypothetical protein